MRISASGIARDFLAKAEYSLRSFQRRSLLAPARTKSWAAALRDKRYSQNKIGQLGLYKPTPDEFVEGEVYSRGVLGVLCEVSTLAKLIPKPGSNCGLLIQEAVEIEGLPTTAHLAHSPDYTYERSAYFPCAAVRAWLIASNKLELYADSTPLQLEMMRAIGQLHLAEMNGAEFPEIASALDRVAAPMIL